MLTISNVLTLPLSKIMALGGVATGNIKAHEADNTAGIISQAGFSLIILAIEISNRHNKPGGCSI